MTGSTRCSWAAGFVGVSFMGACSSSSHPVTTQTTPTADATVADAGVSDAASSSDATLEDSAAALDGAINDAGIDGATLSGLAWHSGASSDTTLTDASSDAWSTALIDFANWRGRPLDVIDIWDQYDSFEHIANPDIYNHGIATEANFPGTIAYGVAMVPYKTTDGGFVADEVADGVSFADCANDGGAYNKYFEDLGTALVADHRGDVIVRLGWEANGTWYAWRFSNAASPAEWIACFRNEVTALRSTAPNVRINWNMNATSSSGNPLDYYPGSDYVDIIGVDYYDAYPRLDSDAGWDEQYMKKTAADGGSPVGLGAWLAFAKSQGKPFAVPEWAIVNNSDGGDDPVYVQHMFAFFQANAADIAYEVYFNLQATQYLILPEADAPNAAAAYKSLF